MSSEFDTAERLGASDGICRLAMPSQDRDGGLALLATLFEVRFEPFSGRLFADSAYRAGRFGTAADWRGIQCRVYFERR